MTAAEFIAAMTAAKYENVEVGFSATGVVIEGSRASCFTYAQSDIARSELALWAPFCRHFSTLSMALDYFTNRA